MPALIGVLMLVGIVVTNAIVLMDLINQYREQGMGVQEAVIEGGRRRLRPILMTAIATIFALLPMALGLTGEGGFISQPLAIVVIGGLLSSTLLTLVLVPTLYTMVENRKERYRARRLRRQERKREAAGGGAGAAEARGSRARRRAHRSAAVPAGRCRPGRCSGPVLPGPVGRTKRGSRVPGPSRPPVRPARLHRPVRGAADAPQAHQPARPGLTGSARRSRTRGAAHSGGHHACGIGARESRAVGCRYVATSLSVLTRNRDFRRLFGAELVVFGADWFVMVPLLVLLPELTGSGVWGALVLAADTGINALLLPYTGTIADRMDRRTIMMVSNLAALAAILLLFTVRSAATAPLALVAIGLVAVAKAFYSPAASAALPNVVDPEDLAAANTVAGSAWGTMTIVGASLGGIVSSAFGPYVSFAVAAVSLVIGVCADQPDPSSAAGRPGTPTVPAQRAWPALIEALRYIGRRPRVRALVTVKSAVGLGNGVLTVFPLLAAAVRGGPARRRSALRGTGRRGPGRSDADAPGAEPPVLAAAGSGPLHERVRAGLPRGRVHRDGSRWCCCWSSSRTSPAARNWVLSNYALQGEVPDRLRGRVFATDMMLATLAIAVSQLVAGAAVVDRRRADHPGRLRPITLAYAIGWRIATRRLRPRTSRRPGCRDRGARPRIIRPSMWRWR